MHGVGLRLQRFCAFQHGLCLVRLLLQLPHPGIFAFRIKELSVTTPLDYTAAVQHQDLIGIHDRR